MKTRRTYTYFVSYVVAKGPRFGSMEVMRPGPIDSFDDVVEVTDLISSKWGPSVILNFVLLNTKRR